MLKLIDVNTSTFRDNVLKYLSNQSDLNLDISKASFVYRIIDALSTGQVDVFTAMNTMITNNTFESLTGTGLDKFFNIFNISRLQYSNGTYAFDLAYSSKLHFTVLQGTRMTYKGEALISTFKTTFKDYDGLTGIKLLVKPVLEQDFIITDFLEIDELKIDMAGITFTSDKTILKSDVKANSTVTNYYLDSQNTETDTAFLNRAQNLFQFYSSGSVEKILLSINTIASISDSYHIQDGLTTKIIIVPNDIRQLDSSIKSAQEILNYFKNSNVILDKPNYISFSISGLVSQLATPIIESVTTFVKNYIRTIYQRNNTFVREDFEFKLIEYIRSVSASSNTVNLNRNNIEINYKIYAKSNFDLLVSSGKIYSNDVNNFSYGVYNCDTVG